MYRVRTIFTGVTGTPWVNTLYFAEAGGSAQQAATAAGVFWSATDAYINTSVSWSTEADVVQVNADTGLANGVIATTPVTGTGGDSDTLLPRSSQGLVRLLTGVYNDGRQIRGRIFIPGMTEGSCAAGGIIESGRATVIGNAAAALVADANSELLVWSRSGLQDHPVVATSVWLQFAVLRSRRD